jgi:hypothetical protein
MMGWLLRRRRAERPARDSSAALHRPTRHEEVRDAPAGDEVEGVAPQQGVTTPEVLKEALKSLAALLANVTVLTALLVYFGWVRAEVHAARLGIDESLLGMTVQEYVLRSVGPVVLMIIAVCVTGLVWLVIEPHLRRATRPRPDGSRTWWGAALLRLLSFGWLLLPLLAWLLGEFRPVLATILFPASIGAGILLWLWARSVRRAGQQPAGSTKDSPLTTVLVGVLVVVCLFWSATNYAQDLGRQLADGFASSIERRPAVVVYSTTPLHLNGPGVVEQDLPAEEGATYRYTGLRFVEHTGGNYFLVSDGWTRRYGVFFVLPDDNESMRFEFVRGSP